MQNISAAGLLSSGVVDCVSKSPFGPDVSDDGRNVLIGWEAIMGNNFVWQGQEVDLTGFLDIWVTRIDSNGDILSADFYLYRSIDSIYFEDYPGALMFSFEVFSTFSDDAQELLRNPIALFDLSKSHVRLRGRLGLFEQPGWSAILAEIRFIQVTNPRGMWGSAIEIS